MSTASMDKQEANLSTTKRLRTNNDGAVGTTTTTAEATVTPQKRLKHVYLVFTCDYPLENEHRGEHCDRETQDTVLLGVYASLEEANKNAKYEVGDEEEKDESDNDEESSDEEDGAFYWQDDAPCEWTARRVWVEEQEIQY